MANHRGIYDQDHHQGIEDSPEEHERKIAELRELTGIDEDQEGAMDREARGGAAEDIADHSLSPEKLKEAEERGDSNAKNPDQGGGDSNDKVGGGYGEEEPSKTDNVRRRLQGKKKAAFLGGGGLVLIIAGALASIFISLAPLKILHIVDNLQERFFATSESAVQRRTEALMNKYLKRYVIPGLGRRADCNLTTRTIDRNCIDAIPGNSKADRMFRAWRDARLENRLAENYGLEIARSTRGYTLRVGNGSPLDISNMGLDDENRNLFTDVGGSRNDLRRAMSKAFEDETRWKKTMYRFKYGRLMERKYGLRRCIFLCQTRDNLDDWQDNKRNAAKLMLLRRVVEPNTELVGLALSCIISGSCIDANEVPDASDDGTGRRDGFETQIRNYLDQRGASYTDETVAGLVELLPRLNEILDRGLFSYMTRTVLTRIFNEQVARVGQRFIPVIGWIDTGSRLVNTVANAGQKIKRYGFVIKTTAMVSLYMTYRTYADEIKTGNVDSELVGSMNDQLSDLAGDSAHRGEPAENSPLYGALFEPSTVATSPIPNILSGTALAQTPTGTTAKYLCDNGEQIEPDKLICDEEGVATSNAFTTLSAVFDSAPLSFVREAAEYWLASGGRIMDELGGALGSILGFLNPAVETIISVIPGLSYIRNNIEQLTGSLLEAITRYVFPSPISVGMGGARTFSQMAGGSSAAGSSYAQYGLGGQLMTPEQTATILNERYQDRQQDFASKSFFARMFDTGDSKSLLSRLAISLPTRSTATQNSLASLVSSPFGKISSSFSSLFLTPRTKAAIPEDPFGIPTYGYPIETTNFDYDPDVYTDEYCTQINADWEAGIGQFDGTLIVDEETGMDVHTVANPCMLESSATGAGGGYFDTSVLTPDEVNGP
jgi:hypothetical protein